MVWLVDVSVLVCFNFSDDKRFAAIQGRIPIIVLKMWLSVFIYHTLFPIYKI